MNLKIFVVILILISCSHAWELSQRALKAKQLYMQKKEQFSHFNSSGLLFSSEFPISFKNEEVKKKKHFVAKKEKVGKKAGRKVSRKREVFVVKPQEVVKKPKKVFFAGNERYYYGDGRPLSISDVKELLHVQKCKLENESKY